MKDSFLNYRFLAIRVREDKWEQLRKLVIPAHKHPEGMNECHICDRDLIDATIDKLTDLERFII